MPLRLHVLKYLGNLPIGPDHERRTRDAEILLPVHTLLFHHVEGFAHLLVHVCEKRVGQVVLLFEFLLFRRRIGGDAEDHSACFLDLFECVAEPARFYRSTGRIGFGKEEQDKVLAAIVFERNFLAVLIGKGELRRFIINLHKISVFKDNNEFIS